MLNKYRLAALAIVTCGFAAGAAPAMAADTAVTCSAPVAYVVTGSTANLTVVCTGGSSAGAITNFSYEIKTNTTVAQLLAQVVASSAIATGDGAITIYSDLSNTAGIAWGCGSANCRVIDQLVGY